MHSPRPPPLKWCILTRSSTTTCRRWTTTTSAAACRPATRNSARRMAILAGDALLTLAFQLLAEGYPPASAAACCRELARGAGRRAWSADRWTTWHGRNAPETLEDLEHIHACKTGALFRACLRLGYWAAQGEKNGGADRAVLEELDAYGRCFGQLFQITDDLLDVEGTAEQTGKRVQKDAARGKLTYPGFLGVDESRRRAEQLRMRRDCIAAPRRSRHSAARVGAVSSRTRSVVFFLQSPRVETRRLVWSINPTEFSFRRWA